MAGESSFGKKISGDEVTDFDAFYRENYPKVCSWLKKKISNPDDVEDIASDAFTYFYKNLGHYDQKKSSPVTWLYVIVNSRWKNYMRDKKTNDDIEEIDLPGDSDIEQAYYLQELRDAIADALLTLPERQRTIIILNYFQGKNSSEIAGMLGMSAANVRMDLSRALKKMRGPLRDYHL